MLLSMVNGNLSVFLLLLLALITSLSVHEFAHALVADRLGDDTAKYMGRLTLNPLAHLDPIGTLMLVLAGFGWGKPVPINPLNFKNPRKDSALVSFAGPLSNFLLALLFIVLAHVTGLILLFGLLAYINLGLCFFNLLPFGPLDGFKIVYGILPANLAIQWAQMEQLGIMVLLIMIVTGSTSVLITPFINIVLKITGMPIL